MSRRLSDDEEALWSDVVRTIKPLRPAKAAPKPRISGERTAASPRPAARHNPVQPPQSPPLAPFERRLKQRVARSRDAIDVRLDLHGMTQSQAHAALLSFLRRAQADEARIALIVTGKGSGPTGARGERGVLRRQVPQWLALPEFRHFVVGFDEAHAIHGGQGALYVRLRRPR